MSSIRLTRFHGPPSGPRHIQGIGHRRIRGGKQATSFENLTVIRRQSFNRPKATTGDQEFVRHRRPKNLPGTRPTPTLRMLHLVQENGGNEPHWRVNVVEHTKFRAIFHDLKLIAPKLLHELQQSLFFVAKDEANVVVSTGFITQRSRGESETRGKIMFGLTYPDHLMMSVRFCME